MRPDGNYGVSKAFGELLSRFYYDRYGVETVCMRIGLSFLKALDHRMLSTWLSYDDLTELIAARSSPQRRPHRLFMRHPDNKPSWWDNRLATHLGWTPKDLVGPVPRRSGSQRPRVCLPTTLPRCIRGGQFVKFGPYPPA